jgi:ketosteroid isomerase-like protein
MPARTSNLSAKDVATLRAGVKTFRERTLAGDVEGVSKLYTRDAVILPSGAPLVKGRANIRSFVGAGPTPTRFQLLIDEIDGRGDLAFMRGTYSITTRAPGAKKSTTDKGKWLEIHRRSRDGSWPIAVDIFNSDLKPGT